MNANTPINARKGTFSVTSRLRGCSEALLKQFKLHIEIYSSSPFEMENQQSGKLPKNEGSAGWCEGGAGDGGATGECLQVRDSSLCLNH